MGTADVQGELWGARAADWATVQEPTWRPVYERVLALAGTGPGTRVLDIGCGAGGALVAARDLGASVSGLDASSNLVAVARGRLPGAQIEVGDMEALPFEDAAFDVVTGFNAFQFAGNTVRALAEARRTCRPEGLVAVLVWGPREACDLMRAVLPPVMALMPPSPAPAAPSISDPAVLAGQLREAGLAPVAGDAFDCDFAYSDRATALRAIASAGLMVKVMRSAGESAVRDAVAAALEPFVGDDGSVRLRNRFCWTTARPA